MSCKISFFCCVLQQRELKKKMKTILWTLTGRIWFLCFVLSLAMWHRWLNRYVDGICIISISIQLSPITKIKRQLCYLKGRKTPYQLSNLKPRPNDRNMPSQHIATLLGATCCVRLATVLPKLSQQEPTCRNTSQHGGQTHTTCCAQQCWDVLRWHVAIVWPGLKRRRVIHN